jgi:hypothetical protein
LRSLIYDRKHFPYVQRHGFATEIGPKVSQNTFNQLMGHSKTSNLQQVYVNDLGTEGNRELLIARGIINREETISPAQIAIQPKYCPICHEANKQNADFCFKCNWIISKKGMEQVKESDEAAIKEAAQKNKEFEEMKAEMEILKANSSAVVEYFTSRTMLSARRPQEKKPLQIIMYNEESGSEGLFKAAIARARNEAGEKKHQEWHDKLHADTVKHQKKKQRT